MLCQIISAGRTVLDKRGKETIHSIITRDENVLQRISQIEGLNGCDDGEAFSALLVLADSTNNTYWLEDAVAASTCMQRKADDYGLGFFMSRVHKRTDSDGNEISKLLQDIFRFPDEIVPVSILIFTEEPDYLLALTEKINKIHKNLW